MRRQARRTWPWFVLAAALGYVGAVIIAGTILGGVATLAAWLVFLGACIRCLGRQVRDDPQRLMPIVREDGLIGLMAILPRAARHRRAWRVLLHRRRGGKTAAGS